ncbi:Fe3+-hydroxamate ABC transporter substrate-binding protein [Haloprofundus marisrubri]|uniref:Fe3+-hydroxamate ABC transporter substrate-binding protein n=1 Tax=Haloprofundus marisrubri TaxID=1514971 RepID=A0A0W1RBR2_9EURY|nr:ABC transporter substrate-binding protein [Haloprofundus marisrubri]KTG10903.1 Fe3+-hydroxamate ABC transporter substrate-binding protein [Haloprofundus marisrubri]
MPKQTNSANEPTRREYVKYGSAVIGAGLLAGCAGDTDSESASDAAAETSASTATAETEASTETTTTENGNKPYSVSMEPVGAVEFEEAPQTWFPYTGDYADMGVALGQADGLSAIGVRARFGAHLYEELPGVSVNKEELTQLWQDGTSKEIFYELDADVHIVDPNFMVNRLQWSQSDVDEIDSNVAPFFGNTIFSRVYSWHDYADYSMYEAFEKVAQMFQQQERYDAFEAYHDEILATVESRLPSETPDVAVLYPAEMPPESFYPYLIGSGTQSKHWNDLNVGDALAQNDVTDAQAGGSTIDYEALLEIDPDAIAVRLQGEITQEYFEQEIVSHLRNHDIASELQAVEDDRVVYGGLTYQGPIIHLFQLERAAQGLYADEFGDEQLFDRQRVADIVTGEF